MEHRVARPSVSRDWLLLILGTYVASFFLPATMRDGQVVCYGYGLFVWGAWLSMTLVGLPLSWPWLANLVFCRGCFSLATGNARSARCAGILATALALGSLVYLPWNTLGIAYYAWVSSMVLLFVAGWVQEESERWPTPADVHTLKKLIHQVVEPMEGNGPLRPAWPVAATARANGSLTEGLGLGGPDRGIKNRVKAVLCLSRLRSPRMPTGSCGRYPRVTSES
jgi:hypothetical protein